MTSVEGASSAELEAEIGQDAHSLYRQIDERAHQILDRESNVLKAAGWEVSTLLRSGAVAPLILETSRSMDIDLIVLGACGHSPLQHLLLGSVSRKVSRHARCSVLVARPSGRSPSSEQPIKFVVGIDGSGPAREAVKLLSSISWQRPIEVFLLAVIELVRPYRMDILQQMDPLWQQRKCDAERNLEESAELLSGVVSKVETDVQQADSAAEVLFRKVKEKGADILMLGDKGRNVFGNLLLGSLSEEALHRAPCSVWLSRLSNG